MSFDDNLSTAVVRARGEDEWGFVVQTVGSHAEGNVTRVMVGGVKTPPGTTLMEKAQLGVSL